MKFYWVYSTDFSRDDKALEYKPDEPSKNELKKRAKAAEKEKKAAEKAAKLAEQQRERAEAEEVRSFFHISRLPVSQPSIYAQREVRLDFALEFYGKLPLNQSQSRSGRLRDKIASLSPQLDGHAVVIRARVHNLRAQGNRMVFFNLRQQTDSVQAILEVEDGKVSKPMVKWASGLANESIVLVGGIVRKSPEEIKSATIKDVELRLTSVRALLHCLRH